MNNSTTQANCSMCGETVRSIAKFCPKCGNPIQQQGQMQVFCMMCGKQLSSTSAFCPQCGTKVEAVASSDSAGNAPRTTPPETMPSQSTYTGRGDWAKQNVQTFPDATAPPQSNAVQPEAVRPKASTVGWFPKTNSIHDLCGCYASLMLALSLTGALLLKLLPQFSILRLLGNIPEILLCIGCWICYSGGRKQELSTSGFRVLSGTLMFQLILGCIGCGIGTIAGIALLVIDKDLRTLGIIILIICELCLLFSVTYWTQLRRAVKTACNVLQNGCGRIVTGLYSIIVLIVESVIALFVLLGNAIISASVMELWRTLDSIRSELPSEARGVYDTITSAVVPQSNTVTMLSQLCSVLAPVLAIIILLKLRSNKNEWVK